MPATHYDVWLSAANRAYESVPYEVLADWLQQGRVSSRDRVRPAGSDHWSLIADSPEFSIYLPRRDVAVADDRAEALEPVELGLPIRHRRGDEDDDVDMVPLIDISLVLLIFFMMTATVAVGGSKVIVPETSYATLFSGQGTLVVGMDLGPGGQPVYSFAVGDGPPLPADDGISADAVIERIRQKLKSREAGQTLGCRVAAHHKLPFEVVQKFAGRLGALRSEGLTEVKAEVQERPK
ncbi:MAG: biopolymer transporter ExbD [Gemmataceae bacterium]|nr:biopolymer transporter ExbD [Gemmataceae bacterium]